MLCKYSSLYLYGVCDPSHLFFGLLGLHVWTVGVGEPGPVGAPIYLLLEGE
jgi:hypothetical protein